MAGFSDPLRDASEEDLKLWLPQPEKASEDLDVEMSLFLLTHVGDQFCLMIQAEKEAKREASASKREDVAAAAAAAAAAADASVEQIAWKRVVQVIFHFN